MPNRGKDYGNASQVTTHIDSYADGGSVRKQNKPKAPKPGNKKPMSYEHGGKVTKKKKKAKKPKPEMLGTGTAAGAGKALSGRAEKLRRAEAAAGI